MPKMNWSAVGGYKIISGMWDWKVMALVRCPSVLCLKLNVLHPGPSNTLISTIILVLSTSIYNFLGYHSFFVVCIYGISYTWDAGLGWGERMKTSMVGKEGGRSRTHLYPQWNIWIIFYFIFYVNFNLTNATYYWPIGPKPHHNSRTTCTLWTGKLKSYLTIISRSSFQKEDYK